MEFIKRLLSKLGKSGLAEKVGHAGQKALGEGGEGLVRAKPKAGISRQQMRNRALGVTAGAGAGAAYLGTKDDDEDEGMEEIFKKAKKKSRDWME